MADEKKTHRLIKTPQISARYLADYMAGSELAKRSILVSAKYQPVARVVQHDEAKQTLSKFFRAENPEITSLNAAAEKLRQRMADSDFERDVLDHNADYLDRAAKVVPLMQLPDAEFLPAGASPNIEIAGVKVRPDIQFRVRRVTKTNKVRIGAATFRYAKSKALKSEVGVWQSAFLLGYLGLVDWEDGAEPEGKLCVTIDAYSGACYSAPSDSVSRFKNMGAACASIAERWDKVPPPANAVF
jgi:hypothetical protein